MATKPKTPAKKQTTPKKNVRARSSAVRVGGKTTNKAWYKRWQLYAFIIAFGAIGTTLLLLTRAASNNCVSITSSTNSTLQECVNQTTSGSVGAKALYTGAQGTYRLSSGVNTLYQCDTTGQQCNVVASSKAIGHPNLFKPSIASITTANVTFVSGSLYKACVTFTDSTGWQQTNYCTGLVNFNTASAAGQQNPNPPTPAPNPAACSGETLPSKTDGSGWTCAFDEEFNGTSLDTTKWTVQKTDGSGFSSGPVSPAGLLVCYVDSPNNESVANGVLSLTVRKEDTSRNCAGLPSSDSNTPYTGGSVSTIYHFSQTYGHFEVRARLPQTTVKGLQETLWLWPNKPTYYGARPASGEVDFAEFYSEYADYVIPAVHYNYDKTTTNYQTGVNVVHQYPPISNANPQEPNTNCKIDHTQFNDYSVTWTPGQLQYFINGNLCMVDNYAATGLTSPQPFDQPFFVALTQALGIYGGSQYADNAFDPTVTPLPATTQVDYVRVWQ